MIKKTKKQTSKGSNQAFIKIAPTPIIATTPIAAVSSGAAPAGVVCPGGAGEPWPPPPPPPTGAAVGTWMAEVGEVTPLVRGWLGTWDAPPKAGSPLGDEGFGDAVVLSGFKTLLFGGIISAVSFVCRGKKG